MSATTLGGQQPPEPDSARAATPGGDALPDLAPDLTPPEAADVRGGAAASSDTDTLVVVRPQVRNL